MSVAIPGLLHLQRVRRPALVLTALLCLTLVIIGLTERFPSWLVALLGLLPLLPLVVFEAIWKAKHYGQVAILAAATTLQIGFLIVSGAQIVSAHAGGVHNVSPSPEPALLIQTIGPVVGSTIALIVFPRNPWLRAAFALASLRLLDELYSVSTLVFDKAFYQASGASGLFAAGGLLGVPLPRAYVTFLFLYFQVLLMVMGILAQARHAYDQYLGRTFHGLDESHLVAASRGLQRRTVPAGTVIIRQGDPADRFYILSKGQVAVIHEEAGGEHQVTTLEKGQFFGEIGLLAADSKRTATIRAVTPCELLTLGRDAFTSMIGSSDSPKHYLEAQVARRLAELGTG